MSLRLLAAAAALFATLGLATAAEIIVSGGTIVTDANGATAEALVAKDGRITFVGSATEAKAKAPNAKPVDLKGAYAYPGFVDSHAHLLGIGMRELTLNLDQTKSLKELQAALGAYARSHPTGPINGRGWIETHWPEKRYPTKADLDQVVPDRPVFLERADGHAAVANSKALELGGITKATPNPKGGLIERDKAGEATGMLIDGAMSLVDEEMPDATPEQQREAMKLAVARYASLGWTGLQNMSVGAGDITLLDAMAAKGELPIRVDNYMGQSAAGRVLKTGPYADKTGRVRVLGVKLFADGALGSRGAALLAPYSDAPDSSGLVLMPRKEMLSVLKKAKRAKAQVAIHAIGDRGNRAVLDAYQDVFGKQGGKALRWRIEHTQVLALADLPRLAKLGVIASMQPSHAVSDLYFAPARLGPDRLKGAYAWESLLKSGAVITAGSDAPVERGVPLEEFYAAIYRHDYEGKAGSDWHLEEAVTRSQALAMFTSAPAFAAFRENDLGTLSVGRRADLSVFNVDLLKAEPATIVKGKALMTIVDGEVVYARPGG